MPRLRIDVVTLFPEMFDGVLSSSILGRAAAHSSQQPAMVEYHLTNIRDYSTDKHGKVDQPPYGGGPGMVIQCQPVWDAVAAVEKTAPSRPKRILMTPQGRRLDQKHVEELAQSQHLLIVAGHYEGIDERVIEKLAPIELLSVGDYILSGGELAAMTLIDSVVRLIPGVLGHPESTEDESFSVANDRHLEHPHYTRPAEWMDLKVPDVLLSGNHGQIARWRREQALQRTGQYRPDLIGPTSNA
tara:strand:+ start:1578 stop:2306 length:729 start_codon:yes stop_codon:yes gene_type:complete